MKLRNWSFVFALFLISLGAHAQTAVRTKTLVDVDRLPATVITTIAELDATSDPEGVRLFADNDVRVLRIPTARSEFVELAREAARNGWEVRVTSRPVANSTVFEVVEFEVVSRVNRLTDGFNQPDRNFRPLNLNSWAQAQQVFGSVYPYEADNYDVNDNCYNRAHYWSRSIQSEQEKNRSSLGTDKVFIFFTQAYTRTFNHRWWFHVAPMIYVQGNPVVLDPTFLDEAVSLRDWLGAFDSHTRGRCEEINSIDDYYARNHEPKCFFIKASMFNYSPSDLRPAPRRLTNWRCYDFNRVMQGIPAPHSQSDRPGADWGDRANRDFLPRMCR